MSTPLVGRDAQLEALLRLTASRGGADGRPGVGLILGEPGSGKTTLLDEAIHRSGAGQVVRLAGFEPLREVPLGAAGDLLRLLTTAPAAGGRLDDLVFGRDEVGPHDPLRIFETALRALIEVGGVLLAVDDLQWVDDRSLALIHYLTRATRSRRIPFVLFVAARPSPAAATMRSMVESELEEHRRLIIELRPLSASDGVRLARAINPALDDAGARDVWQRSGGSPFWLSALARGTRAEVDLLATRLATLSEDGGALVAVLSVAARPLAGDEVGDVLGWERRRTRDAADELVSRGLATELMGSIRLAHDLIREAAFESLPRAVRSRLHARLAEQIETTAGDDVQLLSEALQHRAAAGIDAVELATRLATSPRRRLLGPERLALLVSIADERRPDDTARIALDTAVAEVAADLGELDIALDRWIKVSSAATDVELRRHAEIEAARASFGLRRAADSHRHLQRARDMGPAPADVSILLDALDAETELWLDHRTVAGRQMADRAVEAAQAMVRDAGGMDRLSAGARSAYLRALGVALDAELQEDRVDEIVTLVDTSIAIAGQLDDQTYLATLIRVGFAIQTIRRSRNRLSVWQEAWALANRLLMPAAMVDAGIGLARALFECGQLSEARAIAAETSELETRVRDAPRKWGNAASVLHSIELMLDDPARALAAMRRDAAVEPDPHYRIRIHQRIAEWQARVGGNRYATEVVRELEAAREASALAGCPRCAAELSIVAVELLARIGRIEGAADTLAIQGEGSPGGLALRDVWAARSRAAVAAASGDVATAATTLERLIPELERDRLRVELLSSYLDLGLLMANSDRARSIAMLSKAATLAEEIGAVTHGRLARQELRRLGVRAWRRGAIGAPESDRDDALRRLTDREREVARLVARGRSNREIADALLISPKTVERHVTNLLTKLDLRNRVELASAMGTAVVRGSPDESGAPSP